jgi:hypothetical protein
MSAKDDIEGVVILGAIGFAAYALYTVYQELAKGAGAAATAVAQAGSAISSGLADATQNILGSGLCGDEGNTTYTVTMPDDSVQTVNCGQTPATVNGFGARPPVMDSSGRFMVSGVRYQTFVHPKGGLVARAIH